MPDPSIHLVQFACDWTRRMLDSDGILIPWRLSAPPSCFQNRRGVTTGIVIYTPRHPAIRDRGGATYGAPASALSSINVDGHFNSPLSRFAHMVPRENKFIIHELHPQSTLAFAQSLHELCGRRFWLRSATTGPGCNHYYCTRRYVLDDKPRLELENLCTVSPRLQPLFRLGVLVRGTR